MIWNYRLFRDQSGRYSIREVFYEHDGSLLSYGKKPAAPVGSSIEDLLQLIRWFREAFDLPILSLEETEARLTAQSPALQDRKPIADRSHTIPLKEVMARLAETPDDQFESELQPVT